MIIHSGSVLGKYYKLEKYLLIAFYSKYLNIC